MIYSTTRMEMSHAPANVKQTAQDFIVGLCVLSRYKNKFYCFNDILFYINPQSIFDCQGIQMMFLNTFEHKKHYGIDIKDKCQPLLLNRFGWNLSYLFSHDFSKHNPYCAAFCRGAETLLTVNPHHTHKKSSRSVDSANFPHDNEVKQDEKDDKFIWIWSNQQLFTNSIWLCDLLLRSVMSL